jgi:predicted enzyme related to lactoylglutathione lyase
MSSPIQNKIGMVFVPVSDMDRTIAWYNRLLGLPAGNTSHEGKIYDVPMQGETALILDGNKPVHNSAQPLLFFWTDDLPATLRHLREMNVEITSDARDIGSVTFITFKDLDGNALMVCKRN